jgi:anaerobic ribonucleoside-triphosphate reductase
LEIIGDSVTRALIEMRILIIKAKLNDIYMDIEEIERLIKEGEDNEKNRNYHIYYLSDRYLR